MYVSLENLLNLPFTYSYFNFREKSIKNLSYINIDVNLSASIYHKPTFCLSYHKVEFLHQDNLKTVSQNFPTASYSTVTPLKFALQVTNF